MKKILFISSRGDASGGGENYLLSVMRHLDRQRFRPIVVLPWDGNLHASLEDLDVEVVIQEANDGWLLQPRPWYRLLRGLQERVHSLAAMIRDKRISLVHTNSNIRLEGALASHLAGVHHIYLAHIERQTEMPIYQRFPLDQASFAHLMGELSTRIVAVSKSVAKTLSPPVPASQIQIIHNGLEMETFDAAVASVNGSLRRELGLPNDTLMVTAVGRICKDKGFDILLMAAARVLKMIPEVHFLLVGGEDEKALAEDLRRQAVVHGITQNIHFLGFREDVPRILTESDIFVLSSRIEGHPYVLLEAMACGCSVVATRCAGVEETVMDGETAYVVEIEDIVAMSNAIIALIKDPEQRKKVGTNARQHIRACFEAKVSVQAIMAVYDEILAEPTPLPGSIAVDFFLQAANEIGTLGLQVNALDERLRQVEHLARQIKENPLARWVRRILHLWR